MKNYLKGINQRLGNIYKCSDFGGIGKKDQKCGK